MRTLYEIVEDAKTNTKPDYDELLYALLVYVSMFNLEHHILREELTREKESNKTFKDMKLKNSFGMYHTALNKSPKEYLGWNNDPENPDYQQFHQMGVKLADKFIAKAEDKP